ncbi:MAG TPA: hypothetical protein VLM76_02040 [Patescibacteria group bacterium]|nr:hypothetical protein [Patescibacteria group bacterium]
MTRDPTSRAAAGRLGGLTTASRNDPKTYTSKARRTFLDNFAAEVDPEGVLPPEERDRRAVAARKLHMARLALRSSRARARARQAIDR